MAESLELNKQDEYCCICGELFDNKKYSIQCEICQTWLHGDCVNVPEYEADEIDRYHCDDCSAKVGRSVLKVFTNNHRHNRTDPSAEEKPIQSGTEKFVEEIKKKSFPNANEIIQHMRGQQLTLSHLNKHGFECPIFVEYKDGLDIIVPSAKTFSFENILEYIDEDYELDIIHVTRQLNIKMRLREFVAHMSVKQEERRNIYNCISLEISETPLSNLVKPPNIVNKLSWVDNYWPQVGSRPAVDKYCLMSMQDSYTDFHIDFGGTSVWYHILKGEKIFYLIKPTENNLKLYEKWMRDENSSEIFLADLVDVCHKLTLSQGNTLFIPTGWIHAVLTTQDSIVFGGNFLHSFTIQLQLQIHEMEQRIKTPDKFQFPYFELTHWYAAPNVFKSLEDNLKQSFPSKHLVRGVKTLIPFLKNWHTQSKKYDQNGLLAPKAFDCQKLIKDLNRVLKKAERRLDGQPLVKKRGKSYKSFNLQVNDLNIPQLSPASSNNTPQLSPALSNSKQIDYSNNEDQDQDDKELKSQNQKIFSKEDIKMSQVKEKASSKKKDNEQNDSNDTKRLKTSKTLSSLSSQPPKSQSSQSDNSPIKPRFTFKIKIPPQGECL